MIGLGTILSIGGAVSQAINVYKFVSTLAKGSDAVPLAPGAQITRVAPRNWRISLGFRKTAAVRCIRWPRNHAMTGGFTTCLAMFGNCAPMGSAATPPSLRPILLGLWRAPRARCAAAPGAATPGAYGRRAASSSIAASGSTSPGSASLLESGCGPSRGRASAAALKARRDCSVNIAGKLCVG